MSRLRVGAGDRGGRKLNAPSGIRPTAGVVRAAIFNILGGSVEGAHVLDLFAGSGALGIEALSRGAELVTFVDRESRGLAILRQNLEALGLAERAAVVRQDVVRWLETNHEQVGRARVILLDPPYDDPVLDRALAVVDQFAAPGTTVVAEHSRRQTIKTFTRLHADRERRYGDSMVTVLRA